MDEREEKHNEVEERNTFVVLQIKGISCTEENEKYCHLNPIEGDPSYPNSPPQARLCIKPTTPCASLRSETLLRTLVVIEGSKDSSKGSQSSGSNVKTQNKLATSKNNTTQYTMVGVDPMLRMHVFH